MYPSSFTLAWPPCQTQINEEGSYLIEDETDFVAITNSRVVLLGPDVKFDLCEDIHAVIEKNTDNANRLLDHHWVCDLHENDRIGK